MINPIPSGKFSIHKVLCDKPNLKSESNGPNTKNIGIKVKLIVKNGQNISSNDFGTIFFDNLSNLQINNPAVMNGIIDFS